MKTCTTFDKTVQFNNKVRPLLEALTSACHQHGIPYFFSAAIKGDNRETTYETTAESPLPMGIVAAQDTILDYIKISSGHCEVILADRIPDIAI